MISEDIIESVIDECMNTLELFPSMFTNWEREFLSSFRERNAETHMSEVQVSKLLQIHGEKVHG